MGVPANQVSLVLVRLQTGLPQTQGLFVVLAVVAETDQTKIRLGPLDNVAQLRQARLGEISSTKNADGSPEAGSKSSWAIVWSDNRPPGASHSPHRWKKLRWTTAPLFPGKVVTGKVLERPDRDDGVIWPRRLVVPPVFQPDLEAVGRRHRGSLVGTEGKPGHVTDVALVGEVDRASPPTRTRRRRWASSTRGGRGVPRQFGHLGSLEILVELAGPQSARVHHAGVEPQPVETRPTS